MKKDDLISRAAAIDALTDGNIEKNFDSVYDGELHRTKRAAIRIIANMPAIDAIPVEWLDWRIMNAKYNGIKEAVDAFDFVLQCWKEQEARNT